MAGNTPSATYRFQIHAGFTLDDAAALAPYLAGLGVSHVYTSPILQATPGSTHGYDVVDHSKVSTDAGGEEARRRFVDANRAAGLGHVLDIVPNHMAVSPLNRWWTDVLAHGPASRYATAFDVDWHAPEERLRDKILLPVLGDQYGRVLERGELVLVACDGGFEVHYYDARFPVSPRSIDGLLRAAAARLPQGDGNGDLLAFLADAAAGLPSSEAKDRRSAFVRWRDSEVLRRQLARLLEEDDAAAAAVGSVVAEVNGDPDALHALLERQNYRLSNWRASARDLAYRRFFDVTSLIAVRMEDEDVFRDAHELVLSWVEAGEVDGLRVDHPDGLADPEGYIERLSRAAPGAWIVVEKIVEPGEQLPSTWQCAGTTGYEFARLATGVLVDPAGEGPLTELWEELEGSGCTYHEVVEQSKRHVCAHVLGSEIERLTALAVDVCEHHRRVRDATREDLRMLLTEVLVAFPVYRAYVRPQPFPEPPVVPPGQREVVLGAFEAARAARPDLDEELCAFLASVLLGEVPGEAEIELCVRFQQVSGPVMAKGVEDTAFYRYHRLVALTEVGGDPGRFGVSLDDLHDALEDTARRWPETMLTTSTHDTKRSEDVRARQALLSELPEQWPAAVRRWRERNAPHWPEGVAPDPATELLLYQTLVGAFPLPEDRLRAYAEKATREAKLRTSWTDPDPAYDAALSRFIGGLYADEGFRHELEAFVAPLVWPGRVNALAQQLLKLTSPGVPDLYQGTELWDLSLVDPDNRRPVDWELRRRLVGELDGLKVEDVLARADEGLPKLWLTVQALRLRQRRPAAFDRHGGYLPLRATGTAADHVVAYSRGEPACVVPVAPRLLLGLERDGGWGDTTLELPPGSWRDVLTGDERPGGQIRLHDLLARFPVALLERTDPS